MKKLFINHGEAARRIKTILVELPAVVKALEPLAEGAPGPHVIPTD